ncbi:unnamed protein product [Cunninghamella blakesleeana]
MRENAISDNNNNNNTDDTKGTKDIVLLKTTLLELEYQLKDIKLEAMQDKKLSLTESIELLKRDIDIKQATIDKYSGLLDNWMKVLPELEQKSKTLLNKTPPNIELPDNQENNNDDTKKDENNNNMKVDDVDDDDDDDDVEFEEI